MAAFDSLTRRRLLGWASAVLASPLLLSLPRSGWAVDEHAGHLSHPDIEPAGTGDFIRLDDQAGGQPQCSLPGAGGHRSRPGFLQEAQSGRGTGQLRQLHRSAA